MSWICRDYFFSVFFPLAAKLIGPKTGCQFFKNVDFFDNHPLKRRDRGSYSHFLNHKRSIRTPRVKAVALRCRHTSIFLAFFCQYWRSFLPILAAKSAQSVTRSQVFSYQYWHFRSFFFLSALAHENTFMAFLPILAFFFFHLFAYTDFQNCRRSSARLGPKQRS